MIIKVLRHRNVANEASGEKLKKKAKTFYKSNVAVVQRAESRKLWKVNNICHLDFGISEIDK